MKEYTTEQQDIAFREAHKALRSFTLNKFGDEHEDKFRWDIWYPFNLDALSTDISPTLRDIRKLIYVQGGDYFMQVSSSALFYNKPEISLVGQKDDWLQMVSVFTEYGKIHVHSCLGDDEDRFEGYETATLHDASVHFTPPLNPNSRLELVHALITAVDNNMQQFVFSPKETEFLLFHSRA